MDNLFAESLKQGAANMHGDSPDSFPIQHAFDSNSIDYLCQAFTVDILHRSPAERAGFTPRRKV